MAREFPKYLGQILGAPEAAVALSTNEQTLSYGELLALAGQVSARIKALELPPESRIGINMERGLLAPVSLLACLLSGHTYVPLDPGYPKERLTRMVDLTDLSAVLCDSHTQGLISHPRTLDLRLSDLAADGPADSAALWTSAANAAYVIFTSGSTGVPKAVTMPHIALANLLEWQSRDNRFATPARTLQFTPISFDVHFQELFHTWSTHGEVCVINDADRRDPLLLLRHINRRSVQRVYLPFVALSQLTEAAVVNELYPESLCDVVTAGEQLVVQSKVRQFFSALPKVRLHNQYGPSETHVVTALTLNGEPSSWPELPAIGNPIHNVWFEILDERGEAVRPGQAGELYLGGDCLAQGYFAAPNLTDERFVQRPGGRAYCTGDLVRSDGDGCLHYLGRVDGQLKIRGHRVEPGEVEAAISADSAVAACAVAGRMVSADEQALMAYIVAQPGAAASEPAHGEALEAWQAVWDGTYSADTAVANPTFDLRGWNSSFTGKQLASAEMRKWVEQTCQRVLAAGDQPKRILELGCGTGLFAFALAEHCETYVATDYSAVTIAQLQQRLRDRGELCAHIQAQQLAADQAHTLGSEPFDTIIINSLTQHFVSYDYLVQVVESALRVLAPDGVLFFGDITSKTTRSLYYTAVESYKLPPEATGSELLDRVSARVCSERELVIEPWIFYRLADHFPQLERVHVQLKGAGYDNELSQYRFDATLYQGTGSDSAKIVASSNHWEVLQDVDGALGWLSADQAPGVGEYRWLRDVPNARVTRQAILAKLAGEHADLTLTELDARVNAIAGQNPGVDPAVFEALNDPFNESRVHTFHAASEAHFDVLFTHRDSATAYSGLEAIGISELTSNQEPRPLHSYTSNPVNMSAFSELEVRLRSQLEQQLPEYMLPSRYIPLSSLPLTASGKLDRRRLPAPATTRPPLSEAFVAPSAGLQEQMAAIWRARLMLDEVGANDNFFDLGGSSLQSLKLCAEMTEQLQYSVPVIALFQYPTIAALCDHLSTTGQASPPASPAQQAKRKSSSSKQQQALAAHRARVRQRKQS